MNDFKWTRDSLSTEIGKAINSLNLFINRRESTLIPVEVADDVTAMAGRLRFILNNLVSELETATNDEIVIIGNRFLALVPPSEQSPNISITNVNSFVVSDNVKLKTKEILMSELYNNVLSTLDNKDAIHVFGVAVGYIHDVVYEHYNGSISYCDRNNKKVEILIIDEPDGILVRFHGSKQEFYNDQLNTSMFDTVKNDTNLDQDDINEYVDLLVFVNDLLIEHSINPEESWDYS